jgi:hypothetical protein
VFCLSKTQPTVLILLFLLTEPEVDISTPAHEAISFSHFHFLLSIFSSLLTNATLELFAKFTTT